MTKAKRTRTTAKKPPRDRVPEKIATLSSGDEEARYAAACWLGDHGDARALVPLEIAALHDKGQFSQEGAFVAHVVGVSGGAVGALRLLDERLELDLEDERRLLALLAMPLAMSYSRTRSRANTCASAFGAAARSGKAGPC